MIVCRTVFPSRSDAEARSDTNPMDGFGTVTSQCAPFCRGATRTHVAPSSSEYSTRSSPGRGPAAPVCRSTVTGTAIFRPAAA